MKVVYHGLEYFLISPIGEEMEIAPTAHGAGSILVHRDFVKPVDFALPAYYNAEGGSMWNGFDKSYF